MMSNVFIITTKIIVTEHFECSNLIRTNVL